MPQARPARRTKRQARTSGVGPNVRPALYTALTQSSRFLFVFRNAAGRSSGVRSGSGVVVMGHLFVPAALVLWVGVAVVRMWAAPDPNPAPAVEVQAEQPHSEG